MGVTETDVLNVAEVIGTPPVGEPVTDTDDALVDVVAPEILVVKTPDYQMARSGTTVTFTIAVTNTGDVTLTNVTVTDEKASLCNSDPITLGVGLGTSYQCTVGVTETDVLNVAEVIGTPPVGEPVTDTDDALVDVVAPEILVVKTPDYQLAQPGDTVTFDIAVTNTGDITLTNVTVTDALAPDCAASVGVLGPNEGTSYTCTAPAGTQNWTNVAAVSGDPPVGEPVTDTDDALVDVVAPAIQIIKLPDYQMALAGDTVTFTIFVTNTGDVTLFGVTVEDPLAPDCINDQIGVLTPTQGVRYTCVVTDVSVSFTNVATATGTSEESGPVTDWDDAFVDVVAPDILVLKTPDSQMAREGATVTFEIAVTNTGDVTLTNVTVTDALAPDCDATVGELAPGAGTSYTCTVVAGAQDWTNVADASGDPPVGEPVTDTDEALVDVIDPSIQITKDPDTQQVLSGGTASFGITILNTGDVTLTNVTVADALAPDCDYGPIVLGPGESETYSCEALNVTADFTNTATATGTPPDGDPVTDSDDAFVELIGPEITIEKLPDYQMALAGDTVTFTIIVTNTGDVPLMGVSVEDPLAPDCDREWPALPDLLPDASTSYTCIVTDVTVDLTNVATVTAWTRQEDTVSDSDDADVDVVHPAIEVSKTPDQQVVLGGGTASFTIFVTNTGDVTLNPVVVVDALAPDCDANLGSLAPGLGTSYVCSVSPVPAGFTNVAVATGTPPVGDPVTDDDSADVGVSLPSVAVEKTFTDHDLDAGIVTFTVVVINDGLATLDVVPLYDEYDPYYLGFLSAQPYMPDQPANDGRVDWLDLTGPAFFNQNLAPGERFTLTLAFGIMHDITRTTNVAVVPYAVDTYGFNADGDQNDAEVRDVPTSVELLYFQATPRPGSVLLEWATAHEYDNYGFYLFRSADGSWESAQEIAFVPAAGYGKPGGAAYSYTDRAVDPGVEYTYWLVDMDNQGNATMHKVSVSTLWLPWRIYLPLVFN